MELRKATISLLIIFWEDCTLQEEIYERETPQSYVSFVESLEEPAMSNIPLKKEGWREKENVSSIIG